MVAALKPFNSVWSFEIIELRRPSGSLAVSGGTTVVVLIITKSQHQLSSVAASIYCLLFFHIKTIKSKVIET